MSKWRTHSRNEHQTGLNSTQTAVNKMIRERDAGLPCITCEQPNKLEAEPSGLQPTESRVTILGTSTDSAPRAIDFREV